MSKLTGPLVSECATWLSIVSQLYGTRMDALLEPHGLTLGQFSILHHLLRQRSRGGSRISDIAAAVEVGQPAVTKALAKFRNLRLVDVAENPTDRRSRIVTVRPEAVALLDNIHKDIGPELFRTFSAIDADEIERFSKALKQLGKWLDRNRLRVRS